MSRWFRFYEGALDDPKVQRLPPPVFKGWVNLLCLASRDKGRLPSLSDIAFALRVTEHEADTLIQALLTAGLIDDVKVNVGKVYDWSVMSMSPRQVPAWLHQARIVSERPSPRAAVAPPRQAISKTTPRPLFMCRAPAGATPPRCDGSRAARKLPRQTAPLHWARSRPDTVPRSRVPP